MDENSISTDSVDSDSVEFFIGDTVTVSESATFVAGGFREGDAVGGGF